MMLWSLKEMTCPASTCAVPDQLGWSCSLHWLSKRYGELKNGKHKTANEMFQRQPPRTR
uniref:Uncharacterized protein n=1 Tax=Arion vulgaris TaxID=1028688 RepID=A0A0B7A479_9EUPU